MLNNCKVESGSTVAVWGLGTVGLAAVMGAKMAGAELIVGIDTNERRFRKGIMSLMHLMFDVQENHCVYVFFVAIEFGATECVNPKKIPEGQTLQAYLIEKYNGGFDYTIECVGQVETMVGTL